MKKQTLIKDGKYDISAIMKRAWCYKKNPFCTMYRNDFRGSLKEAWVDAQLEMDEYKASINRESTKQGYDYGFNILRSVFLGNHPENRFYDSSRR